jgi:hypothetical protein
MNRPYAMRCETCLYWSRSSGPLSSSERCPAIAQDRGACQIGPPELAAVGGFEEGVWPVTHASRFCGSWVQQLDEFDKPVGADTAPGLRLVP